MLKGHLPRVIYYQVYYYTKAYEMQSRPSVDDFRSFWLLKRTNDRNVDGIGANASHLGVVEFSSLFSFSSLLSSIALSDTKSMCLKYEPSSERLHIYVKKLFCSVATRPRQVTRAVMPRPQSSGRPRRGPRQALGPCGRTYAPTRNLRDTRHCEVRAQGFGRSGQPRGLGECIDFVQCIPFYP